MLARKDIENADSGRRGDHCPRWMLLITRNLLKPKPTIVVGFGFGGWCIDFKGKCVAAAVACGVCWCVVVEVVGGSRSITPSRRKNSSTDR